MVREFNTAIVSLSFDDGYRVQYETFYQTLCDYGIKATFYIITNKIGAKGYMSWTQLNDLFKQGNEIGSHTHTHPHLTELTTEELDRELQTSREVLRPFNCATLAYPYGEYDSKVLLSAERYYVAARGYYDLSKKSRDCGFNLGVPEELHRLKVIPTETTFPTQIKPLLELRRSSFETIFKEIIRNASERGVWIILTFHGQNGTSFKLRWIRELSSKFRWTCEYLAGNSQMRILTISEAVKSLLHQS